MIYEIAVLPVDTESKSKRSDKHHRKGVDVFHGFRDNGCRYVEFSLLASRLREDQVSAV